MNDEVTPSRDEAGIPSTTEFNLAPPSPPPRPVSFWLKKLLVCNPFYLASAALLLYGIHRLSIDVNLFATEMRQLVFNFAALQVYEILVVVTAGLLVTRKIWYDSSLLVVLENLLWIVPFILVSQAAFLGASTGFVYCAIALVLTVGRFGWLRMRAREILPPARMLLCGLPILIVNTAWPVVYRHFGEDKMGINITSGTAYAFNEFNWFWLLPLLMAILFWLPKPTPTGDTNVMRRWFPLMLFGFWLMASGVHLYALGYVYDFALRREQLAPALWGLAWGLQFRWNDFIGSGRIGQSALLCLPGLATGLAVSVPDSRVFFYLSAINFVAYGILLLVKSERRLVLQLALISFAALVAALPMDFAPLASRPLAQTNLLGVAAVAYLLVGALLSRHPQVAVVGAIAAMIAMGAAQQAQADWMHWAMQAGFAYFLLHSLRWQDEAREGAKLVRIIAAGGWVLHTCFWVRDGGMWMELLPLTGTLLVIWAVRGWLFKNWRPLVVPVVSGLVLFCWPANFLFAKTQAAPAGLLYLAGSVGLFGLGTLVALTKHRWHKPHQP